MRRRSSSALESDPAFSALWQRYSPSVRHQLARYGVERADIDDLVQEVFLVAHEKRALLSAVQQIDPWLREVCRRVAAGHRRRAYRRREIAFGDPPEETETAAFESALERVQEDDRLHQALERLDEKSRDLVALHELGDLPLVEIATLVEADRKTVRKRLSASLRRLTVLLRSNDRASRVATAAPETIPPPPLEEATVGSAPFQQLARHPAVRIGLVGSVVVAVWPGPPTLHALEVLDAQFDRALETCRLGFAYLAVVEATTRPPTYEARQKIVGLIRAHATNIRVYATALEGGAAWIAKPIMTALSLLARPPFPMLFFNGAPNASVWLADNQPGWCRASGSEILNAVEKLRSG